MCYDIKTKLESGLRRAKRYGDPQLILELEKKLKPYKDVEYFHVSGFAHPELPAYTQESPVMPEMLRWGLIPFWVKDEKAAFQIWNRMLNARGETIFEKPAFRSSAKSKRCLIYLDGFFEHHHYKGNTYPFFIQRKDYDPFAVAGLWDEWVNKNTGEVLKTFSIVTTTGNKLLSTIHNNPKLDGPRMPVILPDELENKWLEPIIEPTDKKMIEELIQPYPEDELLAYPVGKLRGKNAVGNTPTAIEPVAYPDLQLDV